MNKKEKQKIVNKEYYQKNKERMKEIARTRYTIRFSKEIKNSLSNLKKTIQSSGEVITWNKFMTYLLNVDKEYHKTKAENFKLKMEKQKWTHNTNSN